MNPYGILTTRLASMSSNDRILPYPGSITSDKTNCSVVHETAGGYTFWKDAKLRRLTRYRYNNVPMDLGGRYL